MPTRVIREGVLDSDRYQAVPSADARLLFLELLLLADDYGLTPASTIYLARRTSACRRATDDQVELMLGQLADQDLIRRYLADGKPHLYIPRFGNFPRALKPKWPLPPEPSLSEIRDLAEKRSANVVHPRANALGNRKPETVNRKEKDIAATAAPDRQQKSAADQPSDLLGDEADLGGTPAATRYEVPPCPYATLERLYHELCPTLPRMVEFTEARKSHASARWRQVCFSDRLSSRDGVELFRQFFARVSASKFLTGRAAPSPGRKAFRASFDFLMRPEKFVAVFEGKYDD